MGFGDYASRGVDGGDKVEKVHGPMVQWTKTKNTLTIGPNATQQYLGNALLQ